MDHGASPLSARSNELRDALLLAVGALCVALNVGLGALISFTKLPIYLDAVGTISFAVLARPLGRRGLALAALVGGVSSVVSGVLANPVLFWFLPTQVAIACYAFAIAPRLRPLLSPDHALRAVSLAWILIYGLGLGLVAGTVSAPIVAFVFGGISGSGASVIAAFLIKSGASIYQSVLASGLASEPLDKTLQLAVAVALLRATPARAKRVFA